MDNEASIVTVDKIVEKSKQWTLEGDCLLFQWMDQISKNLEERANKTSCALNNLSTNLDRTSVALSNATNNLAALQYSQFVENRVHDDDETLANISEVPNPDSDVTDKASTDNIVSFLKKNLEMMNSCHEAYSISYDDSDDDEPATNVIYRSKNPYEARPLPHIYGTNLWKEKWHIGLCDSDNDFSGDENSEQFSESSSTAEDSYESTAPTMSEWDSTAWGLNTNHLVDRKDILTPSNDGESSNQGENNSQSGVSPSTTQKILPIIQPIEEQRYYQHVPKKDENLFDDIFASSEQQAAPQNVAPLSKKITQEPLIDDEPPLDTQAVESDNNRRIGAKKPLNLFDDDEFSSFMDQIVQTATNKSTKSTNSQDDKQETPKKSTIPNLFDDPDDMFAPKAVKPLQETAKETKRSIPTNLFDDSEDIFSSNVKGPSEEKMETPKQIVVPNLFEDSDNIFTQQVTLEKIMKPMKKVVPTIFHDSEDPFDSNPIDTNSDDKQDVSSKLEDDTSSPPSVSRLVDKIRTTHLFDDDEDDDFESIFAAKPKSSQSFAKKTKNLFSDDLDDTPTVSRTEDIIPERGAVHEDVKNSPIKKSTVKEVSFLSKGLFGNDEDTLHKEENIFTNTPLKKNLFKEDKEENESLNQVSSSEEQTKKEEVFAEEVNNNETSKSNVASALKNNLFSDVFRDEPPPDDDIFAPSVSKKNLKIADIFADDFTDDFKEFIPKPSPNKLVEEVSQKKSLNSKDSATLDKISEIVPKPDTEKKDQEPVRISDSAESEVCGADTLSKKPEKPDASNISTFSAVFKNEDFSAKGPQKVVTTENHLEEKKPPAIPSYTALFDDEPPPDDDVPHVPTFEELESEPPKYNVDEDDVATNPTAPSYGGINLFTDVPPDDDFKASPPSETKRIHSIFYDDFPETIEASRDMHAPSSYIFNDEPPPDDEVQKKNRSPKVVSEEKYVKTAEEQKPKPKVSKLKKIDLQINVAALLPSAKVPLFKKSEPVEPVSEPISSSELDSEIIGSSDKDTPTSRTLQPKRDLPENILPNLNRDRAKVQVKRRPSTRKGRQESYRKSIIDDEKFATDQKRQEEVCAPEENLKKATSLFGDFRTFDSRSLNVGKPALGENVSKEEFKTNTTVKKVIEHVQIFKETNRVVNESTKKNPSLFDDSDTEADNTITKHKPQEVTNVSTSKRLDSLFGSDDEETNKSINSKGTPEIAPETIPTQSNPKLTYPVREKKSLPSLAKPSTKPSWVFSESDDDYDLFKEEAVSNKPTQQKSIETKPKQQKPVSKPTKASSTLFSSEEDNGSGDDIFGKSKTKIMPKKVESTKVKPSSNLFSDLTDDDDDDLFGTAKRKPGAVEKSKAKPLPTTATTINLEPSKLSPLTSQQQTATSSNPLADLLGS